MIDLNTSNQINIPFTSYINKSHLNSNIINQVSSNIIHAEVLQYQTSSSIFYEIKKYQTSAIISIHGPSEARLKHKTKTENAYIDVLSTFNYDIDKSKQEVINNYIKNFCESVIKVDEYPRCLITINVNVLSFSNELALKQLLNNGVMLCLSLSGLDMYSFALSSIIELDNNDSTKNNVLICMDDEFNIISVEGEKKINSNQYDSLISLSKKKIREEIDLHKKLIISLTR
jgi:ribonuclease PH